MFFPALKLYQTIPKMYPKDIQLFQQGSGWFAAYLEGTKESKRGQQMVIKQYQVRMKYMWEMWFGEGQGMRYSVMY